MYCGIDEIGYPAVEHRALIAEQLDLAHLAEWNIQQARLVQVLIGGSQHGDADIATSQLFAEVPAQSIADDGTRHASANDQYFL
jgi:hypothetical protein